MTGPKTGTANKPKPDNRSQQSRSDPPGLASRLVATTLLTRVVDDGRNLDALCDRQGGLSSFLGLSAADQALVRAIAVVALRHRRQIDAALQRLMNRRPPKNARFLNHTLHVAAAQILFLEVPASAAVNLAVHAISHDKRTTRFSGLANAVLRRMAREHSKLIEATADVSPFPDWLQKRLRSDYGKQRALAIAKACKAPGYIDLSVKSDSQKWARMLDGTVLPNGSVRVSSNIPVHEMPGYQEGKWWVQDAAASIPARLVVAEPGAKILELCAAPGGKTAQLASFGFEVTALDKSAPRIKRLKENLARLGLQAETVQADILEWEPDQQFDAVLIDAPCSSTGTVRRHPDVIWARRPEEIEVLAELQFQLLKRASTFVRPGGSLVFANCSMLKAEGEDLLNRAGRELFELEHSSLEPGLLGLPGNLVNRQGALRSLPDDKPVEGGKSLDGLDGFFACRFIRK